MAFYARPLGLPLPMTQSIFPTRTSISGLVPGEPKFYSSLVYLLIGLLSRACRPFLLALVDLIAAEVLTISAFSK